MDAGELNARFDVVDVVPSGTPVSRRRFLELLAAAGVATTAVPALGQRPAFGEPASVTLANGLPGGYTPSFPSGVMAGDPAPNGSVIWTRLAAPTGGDALTVTWEVATSDTFASIVTGGSATAIADHNHTVKVAVTGLDADRWYHYRFSIGGVSTAGRLRTAPAPGSSPESLVFAWASCQQLGHRRPDGRVTQYLAHRAIAREPGLDFFMHLGDYVYVSDGGTLTVPDYRGVYARFKATSDLQLLQATVPTVAMYDDGEFVNGVHRDITPADRLGNALQVWFEEFPVIPPDDDATRAHRDFAWGDLADLFMLDVRQYRDAEVPEQSNTFSSIDRERFNPDRTTLGIEQRDALVGALETSTRIWKLLGNPYNFAPWRLGAAVKPTGTQTFTSNFRDLANVHVEQAQYAPNEAWDDFWFERRYILQRLADNDVANVVSVSGHTHIWLADVMQPDIDDPNSPVVAFDFTCGSLTADPDFASINFAGAGFGGNADLAYNALTGVGDGLLGNNPWKAYLNFINQGYGLATVTRDRIVVEFKSIDTFADNPDVEPDLLARFTIEAGATTMRAEFWPVPCYSCGPSTAAKPVVPSQMFPPATRPIAFRDVPSASTLAVAVRWLVVNDITTGVSATQFGPASPVTRRQMALFLWRMMGKPAAEGGLGFADMPTTGDLAIAARWLDTTGIASPATTPGQPRRFNPDGPVTRGQMALFLYRLAGRPTGSPSAPFTDVPRTGEIAAAVNWLYDFTITTGVAPTRFDPTGSVTRGQMATFLWRLASTPEAWDDAVALPSSVRRVVAPG